MEEKRRKYQPFSDIVRIGVPHKPSADLYYHFLTCRWRRFFSYAVLGWVGVNAIFAYLYYIQPDSITGVDGRSFADAFFFSVQTIATIGYGKWSPGSMYGHVLATIESITGLLGVSVCAGITFARFSRPTPNIVFSKVAVITNFEGQRCLMFRAGNGRGNDIIEASVRVTLVVDSETKEGHNIRFLKDLPLRRDRSPFFVLSWTVIHPIDSQSPLAGLSHKDLVERDALITVIITGHDGTWGQTVYARHFFMPENIRWDHRFVDAVTNLHDGRFQLDYTKFNDVVPEA